MRIERMRKTHTDDKLRELYATPHDHTRFDDHLLRVDDTVNLARWMLRDTDRALIADLSCGNAHVAKRLNRELLESTLYLGDMAPGYEFHGPIEETIFKIPPVDMFICSETIEHLDDPQIVLNEIRKKSRMLVVSTPIDEQLHDNNEEHYWAWDIAGVEHMLRTAGWEPVVRSDVSFMEWNFPYNFQIWGCR